MPDRLEPAIPDHLRTERRLPTAEPSGFVPPAPSYSARFDPSVTVTPYLYVGVQYRDGADPAESLAALREHIDAPNGPIHFDQAAYTDERGFRNSLFACYWKTRTSYRLWRSARPDNWWHPVADQRAEFGSFLEAFTPGVEDTETTFSDPESVGLAAISDSFSNKTDTHAYWGSARDRIARSQVDPLAPSGEPIATTQASGSGEALPVINVRPTENLFILRSGQDWSRTTGDERAFYLNDVKPLLDQGMREIRDEGLEVGCYFNRYLTVESPDGEPLERTYSFSAWRSMADIERWCRQDTHLKIFAAGIKHFGRAAGTAKLNLYHDSAVLRAADQEFVYFNCHPQTGMLNATDWSSTVGN